MKLMPLRYAGNCAVCGTHLEERTEAWYDANAPKGKRVTCTNCSSTGSQMSLGSAPAAPTNVQRSARTDREKGAELEQRIADVFAAHGYQVSTNVVREGRGGTSHEIDVLVTKTDPLLTLTVAIECKAWASPIDKAVVSKFADVCHDLGIGHALVVALEGAQPGALAMAEQRGVIVWGPDEIEPHFGRSAVVGLQNRPMVEEIGFPRLLGDDEAAQLVAKETSGLFGSSKDTITWSGNAWVPAALVELTLMKIGPLQRRTATTRAWTVYDLVGGPFVTRFDEVPEPTAVAIDGPRLDPALKLTEPARTLTKITERWERAKTDAALERLRGDMGRLGVPSWRIATTGTSTPVLYPVHLAIGTRKGAERVIAIDAHRSRHHPGLSLELSKALPAVRAALGI